MPLNRHEKRAEAAAEKKKPPIPNMSGDDRNCGNCGHSCPRERHLAIIKVLASIDQRAGRPMTQPLPKDQVWCQLEQNPLSKFEWGFCSHHVKIPIE